MVRYEKYPTFSIVSIRLTTYSCNVTIIFLFINRLNNPLWAFDLLFVGNGNYSSFYFEWFYISRHLFTTVSYVDFIEIWYQFCSKLFTAFKIHCMFKKRVKWIQHMCDKISMKWKNYESLYFRKINWIVWKRLLSKYFIWFQICLMIRSLSPWYMFISEF